MTASPLAELQHVLWRAVRQPALSAVDEARFLGSPERARERLALVRGMYWLRQGLALERSFPRLLEHMGLERFRAVGRRYLALCPSTSFDVERVGDALPRWLRSIDRVVEADIAAIERASWQSFVAPDEDLWPLEALPADFPHRTFPLARHVRLLDVAAEAIAAFPDLPRPAGPTAHVLVHRRGFAVELWLLRTEERRALAALAEERPMHEACRCLMEADLNEAEAAGVVARWFSGGLVAREHRGT